MITDVEKKKKIISLENRFDKVMIPPFSDFFGNAFERALAIDQINKKYSEIPVCDNAIDFMNNVLRVLNVSYQLTEKERANIPKEGPLIVVGNHPFGALEGIILCSILGSIRKDFKFLGNYLLELIPELEDIIIPVNPFNVSYAKQMNIRPIMEAIRCLRGGGLLVVFPAGEVSHLDFKGLQITDPEWSASIPRIVRNTGAPVLPVFFHGANGPAFQIAGCIHPVFRTFMLPRQLLNKGNKSIRVRIGGIIPYKRLSKFLSNEDMVRYLRTRTYLLKNKNSKVLHDFLPLAHRNRTYEPVAPAGDEHILTKEIEGLDKKQVLIESGEYTVFIAEALQIPNVLREIGRLRELTFRDFNEGTGRSSDLDQFDTYYMHLFIWNQKVHEIVGAYRLGMADEIADGKGMKGLYTSTLFRYKKGLLNMINPALEMGRSFIRKEYQRSYSPLLLLWKGIGQFIVRNPKYKTLFGPVSISREYSTISRTLMVAFLKENNYLPDMAKLVKARRPFRKGGGKTSHILQDGGFFRDVDEISEIISEIEGDDKGIPVLLKQYLKLGGRLLGFNIDPKFSSVLDALILVDLTQTDRKLLERYLGSVGIKTFFRYHGIETQ